MTEKPHTLAVEAKGEGQPVIIVPWGPGAYGSLYNWCFQPLEKHCRLYHWHYRGCGKSSPAKRYTMEDDMWDLLSLIESQNLSKPIILGHSYGGMVALYLATQYPDRVGSLILVNTTPSAKELRGARQRRREKLGVRDFVRWEHLGFRCIEGKTTGEEKLEYLKTEAKFLVHKPEHVDTLLRRVRLNFEVLASVQEGLQAFDVTKELSALDIPCLVTAGSHDLIVKDAPKAMHLKLPQSQFVRFTESAHMPFLEEPQKFMTVVRDFIQSLEN